MPGDDVAAHLTDALRRPEPYWEAVLRDPRAPCATHSYAQRFEELEALVGQKAMAGSSAVNILFVMKHRGNAGNTHAVANYMRVAPQYGHSRRDLRHARSGTCPSCSSPPTSASFDRVVYLFESELYRVNRLQDAILLDTVPASSDRLVLDTDGMYNPLVIVDGYDFNHANDATAPEWIDYLDALSDRVMQPTAGARRSIRGCAPAVLRLQPGAARSIRPTRRRSATTSCMSAITGGAGSRSPRSCCPPSSEIRDRVGEIGFIGLWWDGVRRREGAAAGPAQAFYSDPEELRRLRITDARRPSCITT